MIITWILILCSQLILAFPLLHKTEGGSLKSFCDFFPKLVQTKSTHKTFCYNLVRCLALSLASLCDEPVASASRLKERGTEDQEQERIENQDHFGGILAFSRRKFN